MNGGNVMATHEQVETYLQKAQETIQQAEEQLKDAKRVQPGDPVKYAEAQSQLVEMSEELDAIIRSATPEQRDQLNRAQQRIRQMQNDMILK